MVASAGGLDAFKKFFAAMPADSGIAFVLIPHLDPKHESLMVELLARHTPMPVVEAEEGMAAEANQVYVLPPNKYMTIAGGILRLTGPVERSGLQTSIDLFLRSLADDQMEKAICIILSGTGAHGTLGLKAVKAAGGMAMVQAPSTAEYPRMPQSAIATGLADFVLPAEQMPEALVKYVQHFYVESGTRAAGALVVPGTLEVDQILCQESRPNPDLLVEGLSSPPESALPLAGGVPHGKQPGPDRIGPRRLRRRTDHPHLPARLRQDR